jgi:DnaJ-class molecular chaperone
VSDPHKVLGLEPGASVEDIKRAWRRRALELRGIAGNEDRFREARTAYEQLLAGPSSPRRGVDLTGFFDVPADLASLGGFVPVSCRFERHGLRVAAVGVPPGVHAGWTQRVAGLGGPGEPPGDLYLCVRRVLVDPRWRVEGLDVRVALRVHLADVVEGATVEAQGPAGPVLVTLPRASLAPVRVPRQGLRRGAQVGDLVADLVVQWPPASPSLLRELRRE